MTADVARAAIARRCLGDTGGDGSLGTVTLHAHQEDAVGRLRALLETSSGALLADEVGLGKTFTALAVARGYETLVLAPAAIERGWRSAAERAGVAIRFASLEALSRGQRPAAPELAIVDEAHHLRTPTTNRFGVAREICRDAKVLLLSATPMQNSESDLRTMLSLFLGEMAHALPVQALGYYVVRRTATEVGGTAARLPKISVPRWLEPVADADCLDRILSLPECIPPRDGGHAAELLTYSLVRQWASSRAALVGALGRRSARGLALVDALRGGRWPSRAELRAWTHADGAQQLAMPELLMDRTPACGATELLDRTTLHLDGIRQLRDWITAHPDPDVARASRLRRILQDHPGERVIAFSEFADTIAVLFRLLRGDGAVAMLTHTGGRVVGGPITRAELLDRFAPGAGRLQRPAERIDLLLTTDVLSEGVSLHDASVVVHLDLAWNPARLEQRVGRVRRLGATRDRVSVYLMPPPAGADQLLRMEERLRAKLALAARAVGLAGEILPGTRAGRDDGVARHERFAATLRRWRRDGTPEVPVIGAATADDCAALACVTIRGRAQLVVVREGDVTDDPDVVERVLSSAEGGTRAVDADVAASTIALLDRFLLRRDVGAVVDLSAVRLTESRRSTLRRVEGIARRAPRHARARLAPLVQAARAAVTTTLSAGAERVLGELSTAPMADDAWLRAVGQFAAMHGRDSRAPSRIDAVLLLVAN